MTRNTIYDRHVTEYYRHVIGMSPTRHRNVTDTQVVIPQTLDFIDSFLILLLLFPRRSKESVQLKERESAMLLIPAAGRETMSDRASFLRGSLIESQTNTQGVVTILGSFDDRLSHLDAVMRPTQVWNSFLF